MNTMNNMKTIAITRPSTVIGRRRNYTAWRRIDGTTNSGVVEARITITKNAPPLLFFLCACNVVTCARHQDAETLTGWGGYTWPEHARDGDYVQATCPACIQRQAANQAKRKRGKDHGK